MNPIPMLKFPIPVLAFSAGSHSTRLGATVREDLRTRNLPGFSAIPVAAEKGSREAGRGSRVSTDMDLRGVSTVVDFSCFDEFLDPVKSFRVAVLSWVNPLTFSREMRNKIKISQ
jgi:hypothetical protein